MIPDGRQLDYRDRLLSWAAAAIVLAMLLPCAVAPVFW